MRVLILLSLLATAACYTPSVVDCQFKCGANNACPDGTSCTAGFCRSSSTGLCPGAVPDAPADFCAIAPATPTACAMKFPIEGGCLALCRGNQVMWTAADLACRSTGWRLAVLDTAAKLAVVPSANEKYWVGARRAGQNQPFMWVTTPPSTVTSTLFDTGAGTPGQGEDCANLDRQKGKLVNDTPCGDTLRFLCSYP